MTATRGSVIAVSLAAALALTGCAESGTPGADDRGRTAPTLQGPIAAPVASAELGAFNVADVVFLQQMVPHHEQALQIAGLATGRASAPDVRAVADGVRATLPGEVRQMSTWLAALGIPLGPGSDTLHAHGGGMSEADVTALAALTGAEFDAEFLELMIQHQTGAVELASAEASAGENVAARALAAAISDREWNGVRVMRDLAERGHSR